MEDVQTGMGAPPVSADAMLHDGNSRDISRDARRPAIDHISAWMTMLMLYRLHGHPTVASLCIGYDLTCPDLTSAMSSAVRPVAVPSNITPLILALPNICCQTPSHPRLETPAP